MTTTPCLVQSLILPGLHETTVEFAYPRNAHERGTTTVLCGPNGVGKSRLLTQIYRIITEPGFTSEAPYIKLETNQQQPKWERCYLLSDLSKVKGKIGLVEITKDITSSAAKHDRFLFSFLYDCFEYVATSDLPCSREQWLSSSKRSQLVRELREQNVLYRCPKTHPLVRDVEALFGAGLFFRFERDKNRHDQVVFHLVFPSEEALAFPDWSDGQQAALCLLMFVYSHRPNVLLIDELENHLHPSLMSSLLGTIRNSVRQTIVSTHHPHVIFSRHVDRVIYLEHVQSFQDFSRLPTRRFAAPTKPLSREFVAKLLPDAFEKMAHVYKLFDIQDSELLHQSQLIRQQADIEFYSNFLTGCSADVVTQHPRRLPDRQSASISEWMSLASADKRHSSHRTLDVGSGIGRVVAELSKLSVWQAHTDIEWTCVEPDPNLCQKLHSELSSLGIGAKVLSTTEDAPSGSFDSILVCNVLHELTPRDTASLLIDCGRLLAKGGQLIVAELYPLLHPEKFAVAYPEDSLRRMLNGCGFSSTATSFPVRQSVAYCVKATLRKPFDVQATEVLNAVWQEWEAILLASLHSYSALDGMSRFEHFVRAIQDMTTVATICAAKAGVWE